MMRTYVVTGIHPVLGYKPLTEFAADLPKQQEQHLIAGGAIRRTNGVSARGRHEVAVGIRDQGSDRKGAGKGKPRT